MMCLGLPADRRQGAASGSMHTDAAESPNHTNVAAVTLRIIRSVRLRGNGPVVWSGCRNDGVPSGLFFVVIRLYLTGSCAWPFHDGHPRFGRVPAGEARRCRAPISGTGTGAAAPGGHGGGRAPRGAKAEPRMRHRRLRNTVSRSVSGQAGNAETPRQPNRASMAD